MRLLIVLFGILFIQQACVPQRKFDEVKTKKDSLQDSLHHTLNLNQRLTGQNDSLKRVNEKLTRKNNKLEADTSSMGQNIRKLRNMNEQLNESYERVINNKEKIISDKSQKTQELLDQLNQLKKSLKNKEEALSEKEQSLENKNQRLDSVRKNLKQRQKRVRELESVLRKKDSTLNALQTTVSDALINLRGSGLSVEMKNSKVYVSLEEKLLFESGRYQLDKSGKEALTKISEVLKNNPSVNIKVEGHTDDKKMKAGSELEDNWELSVMRATEVVRYLTEEGGVDPERLIASGRGPHAPVVANDSPENRRKNRRTELILTPEMDKLFDILQTNPGK